MKKSIIAAVALTVVSVSSYAQGNVNFGGSPHEVWTATNVVSGTTVPAATGGFDVALVFGSSTSSALSAIAGSSTTNATSSSSLYTTTAAWGDIASDLANGFFLVDGTTTGTPLVASGGGTGSFSYNGGTAFSASNVNGGTTYDVYEIAWNTDGGLYTTLAEAEAADAYVGWSQIFTYTPTTGNNAATAITAALAGYYGVGGLQATPEPGTMALAGLGSLSLLLFRRKK